MCIRDRDVVNGLIYFINRGAESGSIRFDGEEPDVRALLDEACLEVVQEDPLGAYAVEYIKYNVAPIVGSYEADVHITYRRSREQVAAITDATGASAIRSEPVSYTHLQAAAGGGYGGDPAGGRGLRQHHHRPVRHHCPRCV